MHRQCIHVSSTSNELQQPNLTARSNPAVAGTQQRERAARGGCLGAGGACMAGSPPTACATAPHHALTRPGGPQQRGDGAGRALHIHAVHRSEHPPPRLEVLDHVPHHDARAAHVDARRRTCRSGTVCAAALFLLLLLLLLRGRCVLLLLLRRGRHGISSRGHDRAASPP